MDLSSMLNKSEHGDRASSKPGAPPPQRASQHAIPPQPSRVQIPPSPTQQQHPYREFSQPPYASPGRPPQPQQREASRSSVQYPPSATPYPNSAPYSGPPPPPSLQATNSIHHAQSAFPASIPAPSPYRTTSTPSAGPASASAAGYPFPPAQGQREITSPITRNHHPPVPYPPSQPQQSPQSASSPHGSFSRSLQSHASAVPGPPVTGTQAQYMQSQQQHQPHHHASQAAAVSAAGAPPPSYSYPRSQSAQSTPTPTSAHSQHQFGLPQYPLGSPGVPPRQSPIEPPRQSSQPPTPGRQSLSGGGRGVSHPPSAVHQPPSPYQQRMTSVSSPQSASRSSPRQILHQQPMQSRPPAPQRASSSFGSREAHVPPDLNAHRTSLSQYDREDSMSVSPKTRVPSLPSQPSQPSPATNHHMRQAHTVSQRNSMDHDSAMLATTGKRKLEDRELSPRELERKQIRPPPGETNGDHNLANWPDGAKESSVKKRVPRSQPPPWALSIHSLGKKAPKHPNFVLQKRHTTQLNGKRVDGGDRPGQRDTPETGGSNLQAQKTHAGSVVAEATPQELLGPWEVSISGVKPYEEISKAVADFLFIHVINSPDFREIMSRRIQFEIEAKLGTLVDKDTNQRVSTGSSTESVLYENSRTGFVSSMTEAHHKAFNDFLNSIVVQTNPNNPNRAPGRVTVNYSHRRELDRFFDLPLDLQDRLPGCMRARFGRGKNVRARVTYDQKTQAVLKKIVKARVADLDLHMPSCPMDCRLSINLEMDWDGSAEELEQLTTGRERQPDRSKDRLSYNQGHYQIDLTQVTQISTSHGNSQKVDKEHELEIELAAETMIEQGQRAMNGEPHRYQELIEAFVDNVRVLARKARDFK